MEPRYNEEKLKQAQDASLKILLEVDRICRAHGIEYLMDAGTLIGAVRHQGFIPWDDDIDIAMTRENFDRFAALFGKGRRAANAPKQKKQRRDEVGAQKNRACAVSQKADGEQDAKPKVQMQEHAVSLKKEEDALLPDSMELIMPDEYRGGRAFYDFTPRIIYKPSRRHAKSAETAYYGGKLNHLWVDIFILDNLPDSRFLAAGVLFLQKCIYGFSMPRRFGLDFQKYSAADRMRVRILTFWGRLFRMPELFHMQDRLSRQFNKKRTKWFYYSNYQPDYLYVKLDRSWSEETTELLFEGHKLMAPKGYEEVLHEIYGDYRKLPPEEARVPSHSDELDVLA